MDITASIVLGHVNSPKRKSQILYFVIVMYINGTNIIGVICLLALINEQSATSTCVATAYFALQFLQYFFHPWSLARMTIHTCTMVPAVDIMFRF